MVKTNRFFQLFIHANLSKNISKCEIPSSYQNNTFWTLGLPEGVLSNQPCPSVRWSVCPSLNISETAHCFFLILDPGFTRGGPM